MTTKPTNDKIGLSEIMDRARKMQDELQKIQAEVGRLRVQGISAGGDVTITLTGTHIAEKVVINSRVLQESPEVIGDLVAAAINDGTAKIEEALRKKMGGLAGFKLPDDIG